jgi:hypothetical protein
LFGLLALGELDDVRAKRKLVFVGRLRLGAGIGRGLLDVDG